MSKKISQLTALTAGFTPGADVTIIVHGGETYKVATSTFLKAMLSGLPTSDAGLSAGDPYLNGEFVCFKS